MTLTYDPLGRLWQSASSLGTTQFLSDGDHVVAEYNGSGTILRRFFWGPGVDEPVIQDEGGAMTCAGTRFLSPDHRGSIVAAADCGGTRQAANGYDEYGIPNPANWGRYQYTGQAWLPELGMSYYKARMYSPTLGRFLQTDPIGYKDQINLYEYVGDDPVDGVDPTGLCTGSLIANSDGTCKSTGGATTGTNGLLQKSVIDQRKAEIAKQVNEQASKQQVVSNLTVPEANNHYQDGSGTPIKFDATKLTILIDRLPTSKHRTVGGTVVGSNYLVHGRVNVTLQSDGTYRAVDGPYDFDQQPKASFLRNAATYLGSLNARGLNGSGTPFMIQYVGQPHIIFPAETAKYDLCIAHPGAC